jgi:Secretion system C-terminal sorting domain
VHMVPGTGFGSVNDLPHPSNVSNPTVNPIGNNQGCMLADELEPGWYIFKICNTGLLEFVIGDANGPYPQLSFYDWSLWKYSPSTCAKIHNNQLTPLRCNWNGAGAGGTGICDSLNLPAGGYEINYEPPLPVNAGDTLLICFSNYSDVNYIMDFVSIGTSGICLNLITDLPKIEIPKQKALFYNNTSNKIQLLNNEIRAVTICNLQGKEIYKTKIEENRVIDCGNFTKGIYFVTYYTKENLPVTEKILVN